MARFVTEFGAQAVPDTADFCEPERWPDLDWERLDRAAQAPEDELRQATCRRPTHATFDAWREATQRYQALVIERHIRELRRIKYRPDGGFAQFAFADAAPLVSWSVLDHERVPKLGYEALRRACAPVIVVADRLPGDGRGRARRSPSTSTSCPTSAPPLAGLRVHAPRCRGDGGAHQWRFAGEVDADAVRPGRHRSQLEAPDRRRSRSRSSSRSPAPAADRSPTATQTLVTA